MKKYMLILSLALACVHCAKEKNLLPLEEGSFALLPDTMSIRIKNYNSQLGNTFQNLFVSNYSLTAKGGSLRYSSARDGMPDQLKTQLALDYGFLSTNSESALAGFADLFLFKAGLNISQYGFLNCAGNQMQSSSFDSFIYQDTRYAGSPARFLGFRDCAKSYMGLNPTKFDYDSDGIPDYLEARFGLNPANKNDAYISSAGDGVMNIEKVKRNIPIDESALSQPNQIFSYKYETFVNPDGSRDILISNIPVLNKGVQNFIAFNLVEENVGNKTTSLYTAYMVIQGSTVDQTVDVAYWATNPALFYNVQIIGP